MINTIADFNVGDMVEPNEYTEKYFTKDDYRLLGRPPWKVGKITGSYICITRGPDSEQPLAPPWPLLPDMLVKVKSVAALKVGDLCSKCGHIYMVRTMFFSVDDKPGCWCS